MAISARSCLWSTAGPMITACRARRRITCRKTSRRRRGQHRHKVHPMTVTLLFFIAMVAIALWWLLQQQITAKPWLEEGAAPHGGKMGMLPFPAAQVGLWVLLAVITALFALLV